MNPKTIYYYSSQKFHHYKHRVLQFSRQLLPQKKQLVFCFLTEHWPGIGAELYAQQKIFRQNIQKCDGIIRELGGNSILPHFENKDTDFLQDGSNSFFGITSLHIAYYELLKTKGVLPNAVMGISMGEIAAVYAAGGLSLEDTLRLTASCMQIHKKVTKNYLPVIMYTDFTKAKVISEKSPVLLPIVYELNANTVIALCHENQKNTVKDFLESQHIPHSIAHHSHCYPYHTQHLLPFDDDLVKRIKSIEHQPLKCDFYSSLLGKIIPEGSILENDYWFEEQCHPVLMHSLLRNIEPSQLILKIGISSLLTKHTNEFKSKHIEILDSFQNKRSEVTVFESTMQQLSKKKLASSPFQNYKSDELEQFIKKINFHDLQAIPDSLPYLKYLQKKGSIHYLPQHHEWLVLDYNDIEYILKTPEVFSSTIHKTIDEFLFGADPPSHTLIRSVVQPLFSQQRFKIVAEFVSKKTTELLENLSSKSSFNFVDEFSLPLAQAAVAKFIGFTEEENRTIKQCFKKHPYELEFLDNLQEYCSSYFENPELIKTNATASLLFSAVKEEKLTQKGAVSVMRLVWFAGMVTTSMLISTTVLHLLKNPNLAQSLEKDEQLLNKFIEECLRLDSPETEARRITTRETKLAGQVLPAGSILVLKLRAANRDPKYIENPDEICLDRTTTKHLAFGGGYHYCLGAGMARIETRAALKLILPKLPEWKLDQREVQYFLSIHFRALSRLPLMVNGAGKEVKQDYDKHIQGKI